MSTQFDTSIVDLDRTDELPVLDVAAYEASLAANDKTLSRTDTWAVEALRAVDEPDDELVDIVPLRTATKQSAQSEALTTNVELIRKRIAELEAETVATHEINATLHKACEALRAERAQEELRTRALQADHGRLSERRALSDEIAQCLERQLCERAESIAALEKSLSDEKNTTAHLSRQLAAKLMDGEKAVSIIEQRDRTIEDLIGSSDDLNRRLQQEVAAGADLTARLAAAEKGVQEIRALLLERDNVIAKQDVQLVQARAQILSLNEERDALRSASEQSLHESRTLLLKRDNVIAKQDVQLVQARAQILSLNEERDALQSASEQSLHESRALLLERDDVIVKQDAQLVQAQAQIRSLTEESVALQSASEQSVHESRALLLERDDVIVKQDAQLVQAQAQIRSLSEERDALQSASAQLDSLAAKLDARAADLEQRDAELAQLRGELVAAHAEVQSQTELLNERTDELGALRGKVNEHETAVRGFEHAVRVRGEYAEDLMTQLRAARDERAMIGVQLDKTRERVKNLSEQIFGRDNQIAALQADLAVHTEVLAAIHRDVSRIGDGANAEIDEVEHVLEPVGHEGSSLYLTRKILTVGRTSDNDISIPSKLVSRRHARLLVGPTGVIIEDANSSNGCYVNGKQVRQHLLHDGDVLELGDMRYRLRALAAHDTKLRMNVVRISDGRRSDSGSTRVDS